nr:MAG TPA: hypothetical protein [Caudoviricetes sp.]
MNNLKRKYNIYASSIPKMNLVVHKNDRWRLLHRLQNTRRLYLVSVVLGGTSYHFCERALDEDVIYSRYHSRFNVRVEEANHG